MFSIDAIPDVRRFIMSNYSKFKDRNPQDTVLEIRSILDEIGLSPEFTWTEKSYEGARACRLSFPPTQTGVNGKGTDEEYSRASAYAELIERMSNGILFVRDYNQICKSTDGFQEFPDERIISIEDYIGSDDPVAGYLLPKLGIEDKQIQIEYLEELCREYGYADGTIALVPFADKLDNVIRWLPPMILHLVYGSNGMAAGNTLEEAMVQGLSEVFERAVTKEIVHGRVIPPQIPDEELKKYDFYHLIEQFRSQSHLEVQLFDCSLGKEWPVVGLCIKDRGKGTFGVRFGAHPSFAVAVERTLTEAFQGRSIEDFVSTCRSGTQEEADHFNNLPNIYKVGEGCYPAKLFTDDPGWMYKPWTRWNSHDNKGFLKEMLRLLKDSGFRPLIRDSSFLGFPCCYIVVPGLSETAPLCMLSAKEYLTAFKVKNSFGHFPNLSEEEEKRLFRMLKFKSKRYIENQIEYISSRYLSSEYNSELLARYLSLKYDVNYENNKDILRKKYQSVCCYDCVNCPIAGEQCITPAIMEILHKIRKFMRTENANQEALLLQT